MPQIGRYSTKPFPPYRFIPGVNPHPFESPQGHSYGKPEPVAESLNLNNWSKNETYLYGVDLYNNNYWWEAHEGWESLWKKSLEDPLTREFLQGLIKTSAAFLKWQSKTPHGVQAHYQGALKHLKKVVQQHSVYMGIDLPTHINRIEACFSPLAITPVEKWPAPSENYPLILLYGSPPRPLEAGPLPAEK